MRSARVDARGTRTRQRRPPRGSTGGEEVEPSLRDSNPNLGRALPGLRQDVPCRVHAANCGQYPADTMSSSPSQDSSVVLPTTARATMSLRLPITAPHPTRRHEQ